MSRTITISIEPSPPVWRIVVVHEEDAHDSARMIMTQYPSAIVLDVKIEAPTIAEAIRLGTEMMHEENLNNHSIIYVAMSMRQHYVKVER